MLRKWGPLLAAIVFGLLLAFIAIKPPSPQGSDYARDKFSASRAMEDVRVIAAKPHPTGSEENEIVIRYLIERLDELGLDVRVTEAKLDDHGLKRLNSWSGEEKVEQNIYNVMGTLPGKDRSKPALLLMAHHDTVWGSPGSADDTIGIASIFEIIRAINETGQAERDVIVLFTDAEELGLVGARHFFADNPMRETVGAIINFEARGGGGTANLFQTSADNGNAARLFARSVKQPSASSLSTFIYNVLPNDTDLTPALAGDYVAYNIANIGKAEYYHSPKIDADALGQTTLQHMGSQGLDLTRALLAAEDFPAPAPDATFFDAFGFFTVIYAPALGWVFLGIAVILYGASISRSGGRRAMVNDILSGLTRMFGFLLLGGLLLFAMNMASGAGVSAEYYDRLAAIPKLEIMVALTCLFMFFWMFGRKALSKNGRVGAALPLLALGIIGQALAPTATYFISLTLLFCAVGNFTIRRGKFNRFGKRINVVLAAIIIGYMVGLGHLLMLGVGPNLPSIAILPAALAVLAILPIYAGLTKGVSRAIALLGLTAAVALAIWIRLDPIAATVPLY
jgi:hypothetical protein